MLLENEAIGSAHWILTECRMVKPGDTVVEDESTLCVVQTDKTTADIKSRVSGQVAKLFYAEGAVAKVGQPLIEFITESSGADVGSTAAVSTPLPNAVGTTAAAATPRPPSAMLPNGEKPLATPAVRRILREHNLDIRCGICC
jgi:2-oxoisovalerate dehydrogenase E2 component (dihydrolipoyl transacylase)